jgi:AAA domain
MRATDSPFRFYEPPEDNGPQFTLSGKSVLDYLNVTIDPESNLLGNRWLTRDGSAFLIAPSGHGKSSIVIQISLLWGVGRVAFGIRPAKPLRILIIQSEDDDAETKKFVQMLRTFEFTQAELKLLRQNVWFEYRRDISGERFIKALSDLIDAFPCDLVIINPLSGFLLCDLKDDDRVSVFLRQQLNEVMAAHRCAPLVVHHTPKTNFTRLENMQWYDWMYAMSGCASLTNWGRAVLVVAPSKVPGAYRFIAAKRFDEIQWQQREYWFSHCRETWGDNGSPIEIIKWIPASEEQIVAASPTTKKKQDDLTELAIYKQMDPLVVFTRETFENWAKTTFFIGVNKAWRFLQILEQKGLVQVSFTPRPRTSPLRTYQKTPQSSLDADPELINSHLF